MKKVLSIILFFVISSTYVLQAQWILSNRGCGEVDCFAFSPDGGKMYAGTSSGVYLSNR